jgi:hypothetical protein
MKDPDYIALDLCGYRFNRKYPPNKTLYGDTYGGYKNNAEEVLFYDFAVQFYDVSFKYRGKSYYLLSDDDHVAVCDSNFTDEYETFKDAVELIENFRIDGRSLLELIDLLEEVEPE